MMEKRYPATTQNRFYPDMSNVNKNITVEVKLISPPTYEYMYKERISVCREVTLSVLKRVGNWVTD